MSTRKRLSATDRKKQIVAGALAVFAKRGFEGATSKLLAESAGVSEALIYKYFPTKEALYNELASLLNDNKERVLARITADEPGTPALVSVLYTLSRMILYGPPGRPKDDSFDRLVGQSLLTDGAFASAFLENLFYPIVPYLCRCLEASWSAGDIDASETPGQLQCFFFHHFVGAIALFRLPETQLLPTTNPDTLLRDLLYFVYRGLGLTSAAIDQYIDFERFSRTFEENFSKGN